MSVVNASSMLADFLETETVSVEAVALTSVFTEMIAESDELANDTDVSAILKSVSHHL